MKGDRFGGALDGAAQVFTEAVDKGFSPMQFVNEQRRLVKIYHTFMISVRFPLLGKTNSGNWAPC